MIGDAREHDVKAGYIGFNGDGHIGQLLKKLTGIAEDYYSTPPPLVREEDYREADRYLRRVAGCPELLDPWSGEFRRS